MNKTNQKGKNKIEENERSTQNERTNIQSSRRLSTSQSQTDGKTSQQSLRKVEIRLSSNEPSGTSIRTQSEERTQTVIYKKSNNKLK